MMATELLAIISQNLKKQFPAPPPQTKNFSLLFFGEKFLVDIMLYFMIIFY